jgi:hypothetical protein
MRAVGGRELPWRNAFARRLTNTDPENTPESQASFNWQKIEKDWLTYSQEEQSPQLQAVKYHV